MLPEALADFEGRSQLSRVIDDRMAGVEGRFAGEAEFVPFDGGLKCIERGVLTYGAARMEAERCYLWRTVCDGIAVDYEDGRPFHTFKLTAKAEAVHHCAPDLYRVTYDFSDWPDWQAEWQVSGPRKDYTSVSRYTRI